MKVDMSLDAVAQIDKKGNKGKKGGMKVVLLMIVFFFTERVMTAL